MTHLGNSMFPLTYCPTIFHNVIPKNTRSGEELIGSTKLLLCAAKSSMVITPPGGSHGGVQPAPNCCYNWHVSPVQLIIQIQAAIVFGGFRG